LKILAADDHPTVRQGIIHVLTSQFDELEIIEAANGSEALNKLKTNDFDLVILDISMPGRNGLETLKDLKHRFPDLPVLILSMYPEEQYAIRCIKAGASGYLTKEEAPDELVSAIKEILHGNKYITSSLADKLANTLTNSGTDLPHEKLSDREYQIMYMIATGKTIRQIADELSLSPKTINTYVSRLKKKLGVNSTGQLIRYCVTNQLVD